MTWRFMPVLDPLVAAMVSRDLDARLTTREAGAVMDWIESGLSFHVMRSAMGIHLIQIMMIMMKVSHHHSLLLRDNPHHKELIMGGMWGARRDTGKKPILENSFKKLFNEVGHIIRLL